MRTITLVSGAAAVGSAAYLALGRKRCLTWGATTEEVGRTMPGDDLLPNPDFLTTRAITIDAPPRAVWPWLVQMGPGRGGAYTYDWIENLFRLNMHSADKILPQFQDLKVGDVQQLGSKGPRLRVEVLETEQAMVLRSEDGNWVWAFGLYPEDLGTRLVSRNRISTPDASAFKAIVGVLVMEPGSLVMERKMLLGFRRRAEAWAETARPSRQAVFGCGDRGPGLKADHRRDSELASKPRPSDTSGPPLAGPTGRPSRRERRQ
jgi:hypothetical protein